MTNKFRQRPMPASVVGEVGDRTMAEHLNISQLQQLYKTKRTTLSSVLREKIAGRQKSYDLKKQSRLYDSLTGGSV